MRRLQWLMVSGLGVAGVAAGVNSSGCARVEDWKHERAEEAVREQLEAQRSVAIGELQALSKADATRAERMLATSLNAFVTIPSDKDEHDSTIHAVDRPMPKPTSYIGTSGLKSLELDGAAFKAHVNEGNVGHAASTWIESHGTSVRVRGLTANNLEVSAELVGSTDVAPTLANGYLVYEGVLTNAKQTDLVRRVTAEGTEDYIVFANKPAVESLSYRIGLGASVAGLRQVAGGDILEFIAADGTPRLRINAPEGMDAKGHKFAAHLAVQDCAVDSSPVLPYGRTPVDPKSRTCTVALTWSTQNYPAIVDPTFFATGNMTTARFSHGAFELPNSKVIVFGTTYSGGSTSSEVYDFATGTWAATGALPWVPSTAASFHSRLKLANGQALALQTGGTGTASYDPAAGTWTAGAAVPNATNPSLASDGAVILGNGDVITTSGSKYSAANNTWSAVPAAPSNGPGNFVSYSATRALWLLGTSGWFFDTTTNTYTAIAAPPFTIGYGAAVLLTDGRVQVAAQYPSTGQCTIWNPANNAWTACAKMITAQMIESAVAALPTGAFYAGVDYANTKVGTAETWDLQTNTWSKNPLPYAAADFPSLVALADGRVLLSGGMTSQDSSVGFTNAAIYGCKVKADCGVSQYCSVPGGQTTGVCKPGCLVVSETADCGAAGYCDDGGLGTIAACTPKLANGTAIPAAQPFAATCTAATGLRTCSSTVCSTTDNKCGIPNGDPAVSPAQCRSGVLFADGKCGIPNGQTPPGGTAAECRSALLGSNGKCGLVNGQGACTVGNQATTCQSSVCSVDGNCGLPNAEGACTVGNQATVCRSGVCDPDNKCGIANGNGTCNVGNAATVCRSGVCGQVSNKCVPVNGCTLDTDCDTAVNWCNISALTCTAKIANTGKVPTDAPHSNPTLNGSCTAAASITTCVSAVCDTRDNACGFDNEGASACTKANAATVCRSGFCSANGKCAAAGSCLVDGDCPAAWCNISQKKCAPLVANGTVLPTDAGHGNAPTINATCNAPAATLVCIATVCDIADDKCGLANSTVCTAGKDSQCRSTICFAADTKCGLPLGQTCAVDGDCRSALCDPASLKCVTCNNDTQCGSATSGKVCDKAKGGCMDGCRGNGGNACAGIDKCTSKDTTIGQCGQCIVDADCKATEFCSPGDGKVPGSCKAKAPNGTSVPNDAPLAATCSDTNAVRGCISAVCDATDNKCGLPDGKPCKTAGDCRTSACTSNVCGAPKLGCQKDADCKSSEYCSTKNVCSGKKADGEALPSDAGSTTCSPAQAARVCLTAACNTGNKCGTSVVPPNNGAVQSGSVEGGGVSCSSTTGSGSNTMVLVGVAAFAASLIGRRRRGQPKR